MLTIIFLFIKNASANTLKIKAFGLRKNAKGQAKGQLKLVCICAPSCSVMSNSLQPHCIVAHLSMEFSGQEY